MTITWKKGVFSSKYQLFDHQRPIGQFKEGVFSRTSRGELHDRKYRFRKKGWFSSTTEITDEVNDQVIGTIQFNTWGNKATIFLGEKTYKWKYDNFWSTKWSIRENENPLMLYKSKKFGGTIEAKLENEVLVLCGLFVYNHYVQIVVAIAASTAVIASSNS
jgi:hypothetical protein